MVALIRKIRKNPTLVAAPKKRKRRSARRKLQPEEQAAEGEGVSAEPKRKRPVKKRKGEEQVRRNRK